jgi:hypothetical protein
LCVVRSTCFIDSTHALRKVLRELPTRCPDNHPSFARMFYVLARQGKSMAPERCTDACAI